MKKYTSKETIFSEIEFQGGKDAKGREEGWKVTVYEIEFSETNQDHCFILEGSKFLKAEFTVVVQKQKDGKRFGATQARKAAYNQRDVEKFIKQAKNKAEASAAQ